MQPTPARASAILWTVNLASIAASVFTYVYLAYYVYTTTGSLVLSEAVVLAPMVIPVLMCLAINRIAGSGSPRGILMAANAAGLLVAFVTYMTVERHFAVALVGALLIGLVDAIQRVARTVAIKRYFAAADVKYAVPITLTAQFIAGAIAGVALSFYQGEVTPRVAAAITVSGFLVAAAAAALLPGLPSLAASGNAPQLKGLGTVGTLKALLAQDVQLRRHFMAFVIVVSTLQGFFNVSRVALPLHVLQLPQSFVGYLQIIGATAALIAALAFALLGRVGLALGRRTTALITTACLFAMVGATTSHNVAASYTLYALYMFSWEILFFKYQSDLVNATPSERMALVATFQYAAVYAGMLMTGLAGGFVVEAVGLPLCATAFALVYLSAMSWNVASTGRATESVRDAVATTR
ncbi:hypothetical protein GCM10023165_50060 [Variovorax defluvii]|uniref:MFS transporter n=1 Tax=Variovorax defluvii TaxID=913761 RepID=A0ABP8IE58_9BURK